MTLVAPTFPAFPTGQMIWGAETGNYIPDLMTQKAKANLTDEPTAFAAKYKALSGSVIPREFDAQKLAIVPESRPVGRNETDKRDPDKRDAGRRRTDRRHDTESRGRGRRNSRRHRDEERKPRSRAGRGGSGEHRRKRSRRSRSRHSHARRPRAHGSARRKHSLNRRKRSRTSDSSDSRPECACANKSDHSLARELRVDLMGNRASVSFSMSDSSRDARTFWGNGYRAISATSGRGLARARAFYFTIRIESSMEQYPSGFTGYFQDLHMV